jgi:hypothetical protein
MAEKLGQKGLIPMEYRFAIIEKHFSIKGTAVTKLSLSYSQSAYVKNEKSGLRDVIDSILTKLLSDKS